MKTLKVLFIFAALTIAGQQVKCPEIKQGIAAGALCVAGAGFLGAAYEFLSHRTYFDNQKKESGPVTGADGRTYKDIAVKGKVAHPAASVVSGGIGVGCMLGAFSIVSQIFPGKPMKEVLLTGKVWPIITFPVVCAASAATGIKLAEIFSDKHGFAEKKVEPKPDEPKKD